MSKKSTKKPAVREELTQKELARIIALDEAHTREVLANRVVYPDPEAFEDIELDVLAGLGFDEKVDYDLEDLERFYGRGSKRKRRNRNRKNKRRRGGNKGGGRSHGGKLPNPQTVATEVGLIMKNIRDAGDKGNIISGCLNMEFLDRSKARYFLDAFKIVVAKHHLLYCSEITQEGLDEIANALGWQAYASVENNRNQAVGFLVHPRLEVVGDPISYDEVGSVQGIPNLRPAFRLNLKDNTSGEEFGGVVVHLKSMRGGPTTTGRVRRKQCRKIIEGVGSDFKGMLAGDWNCKLPNVSDIDPLTEGGFKLVCPRDTTATQSMGSRLDAFFTQGMGPVGRMKVWNFWKNTKITRRGLSDHGVVRIHDRICGSSGTDTTCGTMPQPGGEFSDDPSGTREGDVTP